MDKKAFRALRLRLDDTVVRLSSMIRDEIYTNIVDATVRSWFESNGSVRDLNDTIRKNVDTAWPSVSRKVEIELRSFAEQTESTLQNLGGTAPRELDVNTIARQISEMMATLATTIGTVILASISGGGGMALIATGPIGLVIGAIIGGLVLFGNRDRIEAKIREAIIDKHLWPVLKKPAYKKVAAELVINRVRFEEDVHQKLVEQLKPIYDVIDKGMNDAAA